jgi:hypothetical protein
MATVLHGPDGYPGLAAILVVRRLGAAEKPDFLNHLITTSCPGLQGTGWVFDRGEPEEAVGQPILVEKAGAAGQTVYTDFKNNAKPDGYTISQVSSPHIHAIVLTQPAKLSSR